MTITARLAAVAAAFIIAVGVVFVVPRLPGAGTAIPTGGVTPVVDPAMLVAKWTSVGDRAFPKMPADAFADLKIDATTLSMSGWKGPIDSSWSLTAPDRHLVVTMRTAQANLTIQHFDCRPGQEGSYTVGLSADGRTMTLSADYDACANRASILAGDWARWPCPNPESVCGPALTPGRHVLSFQNPDPNDPSPPDVLSRFSYTVPTGWSQLENATALGRPNDPSSMAISLTVDVAPHSQALDCPDSVEPGVVGTVSAIADWLTHVPGLATTTPTPITIGGYRGMMLDLSVASDWKLTCQFSNGPERLVFTFTDRAPAVDDTVDTAFIRDAIYNDAHARYILLDLGAGHNLLIEVGAPDKASWDEFVQAAMPIIETFKFTR